MTSNEQYDHFLRKIYECLHLHYRHYLPLGKSEPLHYRNVFYELYRIYESGSLDELGKEPILEEEVKQLDMMAQMKLPFSDSAS